jgi:hypothetical protein
VLHTLVHQASSAKKGAAAAGGKGRKKKKAASDYDTDDCSDEEDAGPRSSSSGSAAQLAKSAAAGLRSIKSAINAQMTYSRKLKCECQRASSIACRLVAVVLPYVAAMRKLTCRRATTLRRGHMLHD